MKKNSNRKKTPPFGHPSRPLPFGLNPVPLEQAVESRSRLNKEPKDLVRRALLEQLRVRDAGQTCFCGMPIWAIVYELSMCFACITGSANGREDMDVIQ